MKTPRNAKLSLMAQIEAILEDTDNFNPAFNVYYEEDMHEDTTTRWPRVFILDANVPFEAPELPVVVVWIQWAYRGIQLGSGELWHADVVIDVYGRNRGEREDIAAGIVEGIGKTFTIYDYSGTTATTWGNASIYEDGSGEYWQMIPESIGDDESVEGTLLNWMSLRGRFWCKAT